MATSISTRVNTDPTYAPTVNGGPLSSSQIDNNFLSLANNKLEKTWAGASTLTTLGTVTTGTWNATTIATGYGGTGLTSFTSGGAVYATSSSALTTGTLPIASGGTGATSQSGAQTNLGLVIGTTVQAYSVELSGLAANTSGTGFVTRTGTGTYTVGNNLSSYNLQVNSFGIGTAASGTAGNLLASTATFSSAVTISGTSTLAGMTATTGTYSSTVQIQSLGVGTTASGTSGEIRAINNITAYYSDDRLKTRIGNIQNALEKVLTLDGFHYVANETAQALGYTVKPEVGLSAQQVQAILPEVVVPAPIDEQYLTIHYDRVIPLLVEAIKELNNQIQELKGK